MYKGVHNCVAIETEVVFIVSDRSKYHLEKFILFPLSYKCEAQSCSFEYFSTKHMYMLYACMYV